VTGDTGTSGACGRTSGLLGLKFGVCGGASRGGTWAMALAANKTRIATAHSPLRAGSEAKRVSVRSLSRNGIVLGFALKYRDAGDNGKAAAVRLGADRAT